MLYLRQWGRGAYALALALRELGKSYAGECLMTGAQGPGKKLGAYQVGAFLGAGPIGDVFRAQQGTDPRELAVKVLRPPLANAANVRQRFLAISSTIAQLDHPHILPLEYSGEQGNQIFAAMPFVAHGSFLGRLVSGRLSPKDVAPLFNQICDALNYVHTQGMTHGNLKPSNVLLFEGKHCLLSDFGQLWQVAEVDLTQTGVSADAVLYMAPEQMAGYLDIRSDIYSLGAMLFHALTGAPPFTGKTPFEVLSRHQRQPVPSLNNAHPPLPPSAMVFEEVIRMSLAKDPNARFQTPLALARAMAEAGMLANDLPSRAMPIIGPNGNMPMLPPPGMLPPASPSRPNPQYRPMPGQMPPSAPYRSTPTPMPMPSNPAFGQRPGPPAGTPMMPPQQPISRPRVPSQPMHNGAPNGMPPQAAPDDPLAWLFPDGSGPARPTPSRPIPPRPPNTEMADFLTARHAAPRPIPETVETSMIPPPATDARHNASDAWWENDDQGDDERDFTGGHSRVRSRDWDDDSRNMSVPSMRTPSRPSTRDHWEESDAHYRRRDEDDEGYSREMTGAGMRAPSRPYTQASAAYPAMDGTSAQKSQGANRQQAPARKRKSRLPAILISIIALVLLANVGLLVVVAPQDCPGRICDSLHAKVAPIFGLSTTPAGPALSANLTKKDSTFTTYVGATTPEANAITLTSAASTTLTWQGSADLPWVALTPASGSLAAGSAATISLTLTPDASVTPGNYTATLTINAGTVATQVKVAITVTAAPQLALATTALHLTTCGQAQTDAIGNTGGGTITNLTATASSDQLSAQLSGSTIAPGQRVQATVMLNCSAPQVPYALYLVSPADSATILVTLGA